MCGLFCRSSVNRTLDSIQFIINNAPGEDLTDTFIQHMEKAMESRKHTLQLEEDNRDRAEHVVDLCNVVDINEEDKVLLKLKLPQDVANGTIAWCAEHDMKLRLMSPSYAKMHHGKWCPVWDGLFVVVLFGTTAWKSYYCDDEEYDIPIDLFVPMVLKCIYKADNHPLILPQRDGKRKRDYASPSDRPEAGRSEDVT